MRHDAHMVPCTEMELLWWQEWELGKYVANLEIKK